MCYSYVLLHLASYHYIYKEESTWYYMRLSFSREDFPLSREEFSLSVLSIRQRCWLQLDALGQSKDCVYFRCIRSLASRFSRNFGCFTRRLASNCTYTQLLVSFLPSLVSEFFCFHVFVYTRSSSVFIFS